MAKCFPYFLFEKKRDFPIPPQKSHPEKMDKQILVCYNNVDAAVGPDVEYFHNDDHNDSKKLMKENSSSCNKLFVKTNDKKRISTSAQTNTFFIKSERKNADSFDQMIVESLEVYKRIFLTRESFKKLSQNVKEETRMKKKETHYKNQGSRVTKNNSLENRNNKFALLMKDNVDGGTRNNGEKFCSCGNGCSAAVLNRCCCRKE